MRLGPLFSDDFPDVSLAKDPSSELERIKAEHPGYDGYYVASGCIPERRVIFEELWARFCPYKDGHFLGQVKSDFAARTWEMYLGVVLLDHGFGLAGPRDHGPDLRVVSPDMLWIEAVVSNKGSGADAVPHIAWDGVGSVPEDQMLLRLTNSMAEKLNKYSAYLDDGIVASDAPFVIAVNSGPLEFPEDPGMPLMVKCLLGIGHLQVSFFSGGAHRPSWSRRTSVIKVAGPQIPIDLFTDPEYAGISGVIYSSTDVLNHPAQLGADCILIRNHNARNPLSKHTFPFFEQWTREGDTIRRIPARPAELE